MPDFGRILSASISTNKRLGSEASAARQKQCKQVTLYNVCVL